MTARHQQVAIGKLVRAQGPSRSRARKHARVQGQSGCRTGGLSVARPSCRASHRGVSETRSYRPRQTLENECARSAKAILKRFNASRLDVDTILEQDPDML